MTFFSALLPIHAGVLLGGQERIAVFQCASKSVIMMEIVPIPILARKMCLCYRYFYHQLGLIIILLLSGRCERGWSGHDCSTALCTQECKHGKCVAPDTCKCDQWDNGWRDGRIGGGIPLFQKPNGDPQVTGWTGYDCSTPICVQAETFRLNVNTSSSTQGEIVSLGGHGKTGDLECANERCPEYNREYDSSKYMMRGCYTYLKLCCLATRNGYK